MVMLSIIVATDRQGLIGKDNDLPWKLSADLIYFKKVTMGKPLIMGRRTHESIGRALPGRKNIILTSDSDYKAEGCVICSSFEQAISECGDAQEAMIMGGASLYEQLLPHAEKLYLTYVDAELAGDTWFPRWDKEDWLLVSREDYAADEKNEYPYSFIVYQRK